MPLIWWKDVKEERQAEFLVHDWFPWTCVEKIGVYNDAVAQRTRQAIAASTHRPAVEVEADWYY